MSSIVEFVGPPGQTLTLLVCAAGVYTPANGAGDAATESARAGVYTATVDETPALSGLHSAHILSSAGWELPLGHVDLVDGQLCLVHEHDPELPAAIAAVQARVTIPAASLAVDPDTTNITRRRGDRWTIAITGLGSLVGRSALYCSAKLTTDDSEDDALLRITEPTGTPAVGGLVRLAGEAAADSDWGSITVDDESAGDITIVVEGYATAELPVARLHYDVQVVQPGATIAQPTTVAIGRLRVTADVTRAAE